MKYLLIIVCAAVLESCKGTLMKRKYMDGFFMSRTATIHSKEIDVATKHSLNELPEYEIVVQKQGKDQDTIVLVSGKRVICKVRMITGRNIIYSTTDSPNKSISNKKVSAIHFNGNGREYFREDNAGSNPIIRSWMAYTPKKTKKGMAVFGYFMLIITSAICIAVSPVSIAFLLLSVILLILLECVDHETGAFKALNGFGKFLGYTYLGIFAITLTILIIALLSLL